ncbi:MAG: hypothetical protein CME06_01885 [Gemmatimonadetes bacterium]|nr:hypothetical protein [Gemmatimonadota bacterium]
MRRAAPFAALLGIGCAEMAPPPGGPVDDIPPEIVSVFPEEGATGLETEVEIEVLFSEPVRNVEAAFEILPDPGEVEVETRGRRGRGKTRLDADRTYELGFSDVLSDAHGVSLIEPVRWAISTSDRIETGRLRGRVVEGIADGGAATRASVALFDLDDTELAETPLHWIDPSYRVRVDSEGRWELDHLPEGRWRIVAYDDGNDNGRIEPGRESTATHWQAVATGDTTDLLLVLSPPLEWASEIIDGRVVHSRLIELRIDRPVPADADLAVTIGEGLVSGRVVPAGDRIYVEVDSLGTEFVEVRIEGLEDGFPSRTEPPSIELMGSSRGDHRPPDLEASTIDSTGGLAPMGGELYLLFTEPVGSEALEAAADSIARFVPADSTLAPRFPSSARWVDPAILALSFPLPDSLALDGSIVAGSSLVDPAGNRAELDLPCRLPALQDAAHLNGIIGGTIPAAGAVWVVVSSESRAMARIRGDAEERFRFDRLSPGALTVAAFIDLNGSGEWDGADPRTGEGGEPVAMVEIELNPGEWIDDLELRF